ncbi:MAG: rhomboid family intramembrane serine protease [Candidatus Hydrothermia bacterium]
MLPLRDINPSRRKPLITYSIVALNALVFFYELSLGRAVRQFFYQYGFVPWNFTAFLKGISDRPYILNFFSSMFIHGGWAHIIGNMWYLIIFGDNVEDVMGKIFYCFLYFFSGIAAILTQYVVAPLSRIPMIGASGAISGVLGAYLVFFPGAKIISLVPDPFTFGIFYRIIPINAFIFLFIWFFMQFLQGVATLPYAGITGGTAFWAHIGGFLFGVLYSVIYSLYSKLTGIRRYRRL